MLVSTYKHKGGCSLSNDTRKRIMEAAKVLFSENGYAAVTTKEIAKNANTSEVTVFRYFDSKRNLFDVIIKEQMQSYGIIEYLDSLKKYDVKENLTFIANSVKQGYAENGDLFRMIFKDVFLDSTAYHHSKKKENIERNAIFNYFKTIKEKGLIKEDAKKSMMLFMSNVNGFGMRNYVLKNNVREEKDEYFNWMVSKIIDTILI